VSALLALALAVSAAPAAMPQPPPSRPGTYRRAAPAADGVHIASFVYVPERPASGAPAVLLVPDLGTTHDLYDFQGGGLARELCARGLTVVTFDWRGSGLSQWPAREPTLDDLLTLDLPTAAAALGPERPLVLVGWGWGGALAYAAAAGPLQARVRGVVTLNGVVAADVPSEIVDRLFSTAGALDLSRELASPAPQRRGSLFELLWAYPNPLGDGVQDAVLGHALSPLSAPQVAQLHAWMKSGQTTLGGKPYPELLRGLEAPVLALTAESDNWTHPEFASAIADHVPAARLERRPVTTFEGFGADLGHLGLVLGSTATRELAPRIAAFALARAAVEASR
jgi:alpha-beta hydrolase superfamily lysophospholipase